MRYLKIEMHVYNDFHQSMDIFEVDNITITLPDDWDADTVQSEMDEIFDGVKRLVSS